MITGEKDGSIGSRKFRTVTFGIDEATKKKLSHNFLIHKKSGQHIYFETLSPEPIRMISPQEIDTKKAVEDLLGLRYPYATHKYKEGITKYNTAPLEPA